MAAVIVFLGGVDKALSLAFELLYLAGHVEWRWMQRRKAADVPPGEVFCDVGFARKLDRLKEMGCDLSGIESFAALRNSYIHSCMIYAGYSVKPDFDKKRLLLGASGLTLQAGLHFSPPFRWNDIEPMTADLVQRLARFLNEHGCEEAWTAVSERVAQLPSDPQPWTDQVNASDGTPEAISDVVRSVNAKFVGYGCEKIIPPRRAPVTPP